MPTIPNPQNPQDPQPSQWPVPGSRNAPGGVAPNAERVRDQLRLFLILLLGLVVVSQISLPFRLGGFVLVLALGWVGIQLLIGMSGLSRAGVPVRGWPSVIIGLGLAAVLTLNLTVQTILYPMTADRERCLSEANTLKAKTACDKDYRERLDKLTDDLRTR